MNNLVKESVVFLIIIAGRDLKDALLTALDDAGIYLVNTIYGKGTVKENYLRSTLGLIVEENKAVITCLSPGKKADAVLSMLTEQFHFNQPNTGIAFTMPVDRVSF